MYDYTAGKVDWLAAGLPTEGPAAECPRIGALAHKDVPTCRLDARVGDVREQVMASGWTTCVVVNENGIVFGRLFESDLRGEPTAPVEQVMHPGPSTFRPHVAASEMLAYMHEHGLRTALVTTSAGRLVGLVFREDVERAARSGHSHCSGQTSAGSFRPDQCLR